MKRVGKMEIEMDIDTAPSIPVADMFPPSTSDDVHTSPRYRRRGDFTGPREKSIPGYNNFAESSVVAELLTRCHNCGIQSGVDKKMRVLSICVRVSDKKTSRF